MRRPPMLWRQFFRSSATMPSSLPFFSVIVATHLRSTLLERALRSLRAQTFTDFEIVVVADALDAGTAAVAAQWLQERDLFVKRSGAPGPAESRNLALRLASGEWLMFLDDDDTFAPHHLEVAHRRITQPPSEAERGARLLFSDFEVVTENREQAQPAPLSRTPVPLQGNEVAGLHVKNFIPNNALVYHRQTLADCRVDPHLDSQEDWDFLLGACANATPTWYAGGGAVVHKDYINPGMRRGTQTTSNNSTVIVDFLHIYRRWRAPTPQLQAARKALIKSVGLDLPVEWF
jgi:glycosyltransferase involved in cell wall biosynthesis